MAPWKEKEATWPPREWNGKRSYPPMARCEDSYACGHEKRDHKLNEKGNVARAATLLLFQRNRKVVKGKSLRDTYVDESCIEWSGHLDKKDTQDGTVSEKGRSWCLIAIIQAVSLSLSDNTDEDETDRNLLRSQLLWKFSPQKDSAQSDSYHRAFNGENLLKHFIECLVPNLGKRPIPHHQGRRSVLLG
jgi:hypothetical protein